MATEAISGLSPVCELDPLRDSRWLELIGRHPAASIFHTPVWLDALRRSYGYEPVAFTTSPPGAKLANGIVFCRVNSWLTGRRLVSVPFSDHCEPLVDSEEELDRILHVLTTDREIRNWKYIEFRPQRRAPGATAGFFEQARFYSHMIDLSPSLEDLFKNLHKDSIQRKIRRAEREGLVYREGRSQELLDTFYHLQRLTRRRHKIPPQPLAWFRNLVDCFGDALKIRIASQNGKPIAGIVTLSYRQRMVYKFGSSDAAFHNLGGMQLLYWRMIQEAKQNGMHEVDLGRSDWDNPGLIQFKDRWNAVRSTLTYWRCPGRLPNHGQVDWKSRAAKHLFACAPDPIRTALGRMLYPHLG